jgi:hypothetical protein
MPTVARWRTSFTRSAERHAATVGRLVRAAPGALGAAVVAVGVGMIYAPAGVIVAGLFLLAIDRGIE